MEVFRGGCKSILSSGERTKGRSSTGGGTDIKCNSPFCKLFRLPVYLSSLSPCVKCRVTGTAYLQRLGKIQLCRLTQFLSFPHQAFDAYFRRKQHHELPHECTSTEPLADLFFFSEPVRTVFIPPRIDTYLDFVDYILLPSPN